MAGIFDFLPAFLRRKTRTVNTVNKKKTTSGNTQRKPVAAFRKVYRDVYYGERKKTKGGLTKNDLVMLKDGRIVAKARRAHGKRMYASMSNAARSLWAMHKGVLPKDKK